MMAPPTAALLISTALIPTAALQSSAPLVMLSASKRPFESPVPMYKMPSADSVGDDAHNSDLSQRRAASIRAWLLAHGIDGARVTARGYGETQPIADNGTAAGRARNRRVEFVVTAREAPPRE